MDRLILDTTILVAAERSGDVLGPLIADEDDVAIAAITVAELLVGVELARGRRRDARMAFVDELVATVPAIDYDLAIARDHARLLAHARRSGRPRGAHDLLIAASALATGRTVVTADAAGFVGLPGVAVRIAA